MDARGSNDDAISQNHADLPVGDRSNAPPPGPEESPRERLSYLHLWYFLIFSIFMAEVAAMIVAYALPPLPYIYVTLIDAGIMTILIFPMLYFLSFRPLLRHLDQRQQAERELRQQKELQEKFFDSIDLLIAYMDRDFNFIRVNGAYARADGHMPDDFVGKNHFALYPHSENERIFRQVVERGEPFYVYEERFAFGEHSRRGSIYWDWSLQPVKSPAGDVEGLVLSLLDVTERKRAQEQVREMALFPALNPDAVVRVDARGRVNMANPAAEQIELRVGAQLAEVIPGLRELNIASCIADGTTQQVQETDLGGRVLQWTMHGSSELGLAFLYSTDITLRKRAEESIRQLSRIVEQTEDTVVVTDCDGLIEYVNPSFERLTGYSKEEVLGKTPRVLKSGLHDMDFYRDLWDTVLRGDVYQGEIANCRKNGELFYEVKTITPLRDAQGKITHFVATGKDITRHKLDEEKLRKAYDELELRVQERTEELWIANAKLEEEIDERKQAEAALRSANEELSRFNNAMVGREVRMIELKKEVNELCGSARLPRRYPLDFEKK
jgi:PAS domain S-box-containing protein